MSDPKNQELQRREARQQILRTLFTEAEAEKVDKTYAQFYKDLCKCRKGDIPAAVRAFGGGIVLLGYALECLKPLYLWCRRQRDG